MYVKDMKFRDFRLLNFAPKDFGIHPMRVSRSCSHNSETAVIDASISPQFPRGIPEWKRKRSHLQVLPLCRVSLVFWAWVRATSSGMSFVNCAAATMGRLAATSNAA
jgi:hypothetical protein